MDGNRAALKTGAGAAVLCLALAMTLIAWGAEPGKGLRAFPELQLVWSGKTDRGVQIFFSRYAKKGWVNPVRLSDADEMVFLPGVASGTDNRIWAAWSRLDTRKKTAYLEYAMYDGSSWRQPERIRTGLKDCRAVTVMVDRDNIPWLAWEGIEKKYTDIFVSRWSDGKWSPARRVHVPNAVPDIEPALSLDAFGRLVLAWRTFSDGRYVETAKRWDGVRWQPAAFSPEEDVVRQTLGSKMELPPLPAGLAAEPHRVGIFMKGARGAASLPLARIYQ
ncbi:MAG: hypothetical protein Kow0089_00440 [Desulfobulbaceae bacterium]